MRPPRRPDGTAWHEPPLNPPIARLVPVPTPDFKTLLDSFGAKGDTSTRVAAEMWARGWVVMQGPIPEMRIT